MNDWSASNLYRGLECPAHYELQHSHWKPPAVNAAAYRGNVIHRYIEEIGIGANPDKALVRVPDEFRPICANIPVGQFLGFGSDLEVAYIHNIAKDEIRYVGEGIKRQYGDLDFADIPGTIDIQNVLPDRVVIKDVKTGKTPVPPAKENPQLLFQAQCAMRYHERDLAEVSIIKIAPDGTPNIDTAEVTRLDIDLFNDQLKEMYRRRLQCISKPKEEWIEGTEIKEGGHCNFCPARKACPIKKRKREEKKKRNG